MRLVGGWGVCVGSLATHEEHRGEPASCFAPLLAVTVTVARRPAPSVALPRGRLSLGGSGAECTVVSVARSLCSVFRYLLCLFHFFFLLGVMIPS